jgi:hypothetical protein
MNEAYLSQIPLFSLPSIYSHEEYDAEQIFYKACVAVCGDELAQAVIEDIECFQHQGLDKLTSVEKADLSRKYAHFMPHPITQEILAWLSGEYVFDPACLT